MMLRDILCIKCRNLTLPTLISARDEPMPTMAMLAFDNHNMRLVYLVRVYVFVDKVGKMQKQDTKRYAFSAAIYMDMKAKTF